jgi:hypothetical protein
MVECLCQPLSPACDGEDGPFDAGNHGDTLEQSQEIFLTRLAEKFTTDDPALVRLAGGMDHLRYQRKGSGWVQGLHLDHEVRARRNGSLEEETDPRGGDMPHARPEPLLLCR